MRFSDKTEAIFEALSEFQGEVSNPKASGTNPHYKSKYARLDDILEIVRPLLGKHGLSVIQLPCSGDGGVGVITLITHKSGQFVESDPYYLKLQKQDAQGGGSAITYARRYSLAAALGIAQEDDDGNNAAEISKEIKKCVVCNKPVEPALAQKSAEINGKVYCSGTCKNADKELNVTEEKQHV